MLTIDVAFVLALFLISAILGVGLAYEPLQAWRRFSLIAIGLTLYLLAANFPRRIRVANRELPVLRLFLAALPTLILIYFLLTNNWSARVGKLSWFDPILEWFASRQMVVSGATLDSNNLGGVLAALLPLQISALVSKRTCVPGWIAAALLIFSILGLLLSESRGAWIALVMVAWLWMLWEVVGQFIPGARGRVWLVTVSIMVSIAMVVITLTPLGARLFDYRSDRWQVWTGSLDLASDYQFTGLGLGGFDMAYSTYVLLVHVPHTLHAHNLFLDIWLEQGLLGLIGFVALVLIGVLNKPGLHWRMAALVSVGVVIVHGFLDDAFYGYGGNAIPFLFIPLGILVRQNDSPLEPNIQKPRRLLVPFLGGAMALTALITVIVPSARAAAFANLGALAQTRAELGVYDQTKYGFQDRLRREGIVDLKPAVEFYQFALATDPTNATANRRLAQIEIARGDYASARRHLEAAFALAPVQRATRQMLGEVYALSGNIESGAKLWQSIDMGASQVLVREWWYEALDQKKNVDVIEQTARAAGQ